MDRAKQAYWKALAAEPEFRSLLRSRRRFVIPATIFFIAYYLALPVSVGFWPTQIDNLIDLLEWQVNRLPPKFLD